MCSRIVLYYCLFFSPLIASAQVVLQDSTKRIQVGMQTEALEDKTARLTIEQVRQRTDFKKGTANDFHFGFTDSAIWFRVQLTNQSNYRKWHIQLFDSFNIDYADLYLEYPDGHLDHQKGGLKRPYPNRGIVEMTPLFPVTIPTGTTVTAYIRIESSLSMVGEVMVWEEYHNLTAGRSFSVALWLYLGLFILRTLNTFVLVTIIRDRHFRFYTFCSFLLYTTNFARVGLYHILFSGHPRLMEWLLYGFVRLLPASLAMWAYFLLDNRPQFKPLRGLAVGLVVAGVAGSLLPFWVQTATITKLYSALFLLAYLLFISSVVLVWKTHSRPPLHFLLPMVVCAAMFFVAQLQLLNIIYYGGLVGRIMIGVLALEIISISLVMGRIIQNYIRNQISAANALMQNKMEVDTLREVNLLKTRFFTNISHEFRTPLTLLIGPLTDRIRQFPGDELYGLMHRNATRLQTLINQILDLAKAEAGQLPLQLQPGDLVADVRLWISSFDSLAESRSIRLTLNQNQPAYPTQYDPDKLQSILTNLVSNALKFTPNGGLVHVNAHYGEVFTLTVADSGAGIAADQLPHIFDRFYQAETDNSKQTDQVGTGIGLALVNELVKLLGGSITVESVVGKGTTFTLTLPLDIQESPMEWNVLPIPARRGPTRRVPVSLQVAETDVVSAADSPTVLIVEDNADMRAYLRRILADPSDRDSSDRPNFTVFEAADGQQGLEMALDQMPDLILTDWMMPRLDGLNFCRALRADPRTDHIPVVMLTAKAALENRLDGLETGADDYLVKPFLATELIIRLQNLLKRQRAMQDFFQRQLEAVAARPTESAGAEIIAPETLDRNELNQLQQQFLERVYGFLDTQLDNVALDADLLASELGMSNRTLHRKLSTLVDMTPGELIRTYRLRQAAQLLRSGVSPTETAYRVGFDNPSSFSRAFRGFYGKTPSEFGR